MELRMNLRYKRYATEFIFVYSTHAEDINDD